MHFVVLNAVCKLTFTFLPPSLPSPLNSQLEDPVSYSTTPVEYLRQNFPGPVPSMSFSVLGSGTTTHSDSFRSYS